MATIATLTMNPSVDISSAVDRVAPNDKLRCDPPQREAGGGGLNVARVVVELGESALAVYPAGGSTGNALGELLGDLPSDAVRIAGTTRTNTTVTSRASNDQYRFVMPGPELSEDEWRACLDRLDALDPRPDFIVASGSLPRGAPPRLYADLVRRCHDEDVRVIVDASGEALRLAAAETPYLLKPNVRELEQLLGEDEIDDHLEDAADELVERGAAEVLVLSLGAGGAYVTGRDVDGVHVRSPTVPISSRVGAGDSMVGGIVTALARGEDPVTAAQFGVAAGAAAVLTEGTRLCRRDDVERLFAGMQDADQAA